MFFCYSPPELNWCGAQFYPTEEEARLAAREALLWCQEQAQKDGNWDPLVALICWGEVKQQVQTTKRHRRPFDAHPDDIAPDGIPWGTRPEAFEYGLADVQKE